jgi:hypothetical protein
MLTVNFQIDDFNFTIRNPGLSSLQQHIINET